VAKDCSAAAVLVTAIAAVVVGALIFLPRILALLGIG
jgi:diacylglycerol kinase